MQPKLKIVWSVDAFEKTGETLHHVIATLRSIAKKTPTTIEPTYVLNPEGFDVPLEFSTPWVKYYTPAAEKSMNSLLKEVQIPGMTSPKILKERKTSLTAAVNRLAKHAKEKSADLIILGTHARKGLSRFFLGSFAETMLHCSKVPVLVVGHENAEVNFDHILFATDFADKSRQIFKKVLKLAKKLGSQVTLFYCVPHPIEPVFQSGVYLLGGGWIPVPDYIGAQEEMARKAADQLIKEANKQGVPCDLKIESGIVNIPDSIMKAAQDNQATLIAMAGQSTRTSAFLLGSVTRQVIRNSKYPVWVLHT